MIDLTPVAASADHLPLRIKYHSADGNVVSGIRLQSHGEGQPH